MKFFEIVPYMNGITEMNNLLFEVDYRKWMGGAVLTVTPVCRKDFSYEQIYDFSKDPLTAGVRVCVIPMARRSQKKMDAAFADLCGKHEQICKMWNERNFEGIKNMYA